jgi:hypothetical protein
MRVNLIIFLPKEELTPEIVEGDLLEKLVINRR